MATPRLEYIDGLRALAASWVVLHHTIEVAEPTNLLDKPVIGDIIGTLFFGQFPVMVFLMLSGFVLYYPCVRRNPDAPRLTSTMRTFFVRRWKRIAPPYLWAGLISLAIVAIPVFQVGRWTRLGAINWTVIGSHLLFIHNVIPGHATQIDYPMWSIGLEFQLYLLFPLMVWAFRRMGRVPVLVGTLALAVVIHAAYSHVSPGFGAVLRDGPFAYLEVFALGMLAAALTVRGREIAPRWILAGVAVAGFAVVRAGSGNGIVHDLATSVGAFAILMICVDTRGATVRVLSNPALVRVGVFSYSLYLIHAPVLHLLDVGLDNAGVPPAVQFGLLVFAGFPLIVAAAYGFHCAFERPFMRGARPARVAPAIAG